MEIFFALQCEGDFFDGGNMKLRVWHIPQVPMKPFI
ncbi:hypothetical protein ABKF32_004496, partial [Escherichia coli]